MNVKETVMKQEEFNEEELMEQDPLEVQSDFIKNKKRRTIEITDIIACTFCGVEFSEMDFQMHFNACRIKNSRSRNSFPNNADTVVRKEELNEEESLSIIKQNTLVDGKAVKKEEMEDEQMPIIEDYEENYCISESKIEIHNDVM